MELQSVVAHALKVSSEFALCDSCLGRLYVRRLGLSSCKRLGGRIRREMDREEPEECYICRGLCRRLGTYVDRFRNLTYDVEFESFMVGASLRPSVLDRDDAVRSRYLLKGTDSIKAEIAGELAKKFRRATGATIDHTRSDLTITVSFRNDSVDIHTRPVAVSGRYIKRLRGMPQKRPRCSGCGGSGCTLCVGAQSVERQISGFLRDAMGATQARISWIGGEDKDSLVLGDGRPFFARLLNPRRRSHAFPATVELPCIELASLEVSQDMRKMPVRFRSVIRVTVETEDEVPSRLLRSLKTIPAGPVLIYEGASKINQKTIHSVRYARRSPTRVVLLMEAEGGLPVKRFVEGGSISPSVADMLETGCTCRRFDFLRVTLEQEPPAS